MNRPKNWRPSDAGPERALDDIRQVEWSDAEGFRREKAGWLRAVRRVGDLRLANMVWLLMVLGDYMKPQNEAAWPSVNRLAADLGWSIASVKRAIALAIAWGWLICDRRYASSNRYLMAFSVSVRADVEDRHGLRLQPFLDRRGSGIKPELTNSSNLSSQWDQTCAHSELKPELKYLRKIPETENEEEYLTDPLGETEQDVALHQPEISISDLHRALGEGDIDLGQHRAARLGRSRIEYLRMQVDELGLNRAAPQIRDAACDADQAELAAHSGQRMKKPDRREDDGAQGSLFAWAESRPITEIVSLDQHRAQSARWRLVIAPRALGPLDRFDRKYGLVPPTPIIKIDETRPLRRA